MIPYHWQYLPLLMQIVVALALAGGMVVGSNFIGRHRNTKVAPKTLNQKRYVDSIRRNTITFGIGPAGTGKTFLAVAMAAAALTERKVQRIILTRPAVEAGTCRQSVAGTPYIRSQIASPPVALFYPFVWRGAARIRATFTNVSQ